MADSRQADTELLHGNAVLEPSSLQQPPKKSYPAILHVAVLSVFMLPFAMVPYTVARRQNAKLARTVKMLNDDLQRLRSQLEVGSALQQTTQAELRSLAASVSETLKQLRELREQTSRLESHRSASEQSTQTELSRLLDELQHSRYFSWAFGTRMTKELTLRLVIKLSHYAAWECRWWTLLPLWKKSNWSLGWIGVDTKIEEGLRG
ncbi:hypothetical protein D9613_005538 [Agrocybe pediades]|uniref:Uncharacterized protein n=1 Tax=Agrocybe pediades TaxID=84607 RepID=A0A8H4R124_9AGAR|nr:hypothetical protein D9613_005538 [Agrocybe pediades]